MDIQLEMNVSIEMLMNYAKFQVNSFHCVWDNKGQSNKRGRGALSPPLPPSENPHSHTDTHTHTHSHTDTHRQTDTDTQPGTQNFGLIVQAKIGIQWKYFFSLKLLTSSPISFNKLSPLYEAISNFSLRHRQHFLFVVLKVPHFTNVSLLLIYYYR